MRMVDSGTGQCGQWDRHFNNPFNRHRDLYKYNALSQDERNSSKVSRRDRADGNLTKSYHF